MHMSAHFILYVDDQRRSEGFYRSVLATEPRLGVAGMTEFDPPGGGVPGLMPERNIRQLVGARHGQTRRPPGACRGRSSTVLPEPEASRRRALSAGARERSPALPGSRGHAAGYSPDPDGHVLAFATRSGEP